MGRKKRSANNNVKRERFAVKELARLKKCLGIVDEKSDGTQILNKVADITTVTDAKAIKKVLFNLAIASGYQLHPIICLIERNLNVESKHCSFRNKTNRNCKQ